jgi:5-methylcytosine-specific restriction endonuclease McrA
MLPYGDYLHSPGWRARVEAAIDRAGGRCQVCNADRWLARLDVHHRTYERLGREEPGDLTVLCRDCHRLFHERGKLAR